MNRRRTPGSPYRVKVIETHDFKSEAACLAYFQQQKQEASNL